VTSTSRYGQGAAPDHQHRLANLNTLVNHPLAAGHAGRWDAPADLPIPQDCRSRSWLE
jgi:hypothetical protein